MSEGFVDIDILVGKRLKQRRRYLNMSQKYLANMLGITFQQVQKYEKGANRLGVARLFQICKALEVQPSYFLGGYPDFVDNSVNHDVYVSSARANMLRETQSKITEAGREDIESTSLNNDFLIELIKICNEITDVNKKKLLLTIAKAFL